MNVFIPTYKRLDRQPTATALAKAGVPCTLVVRPEEAPGAAGVAAKLVQQYGGPVSVWQLPEGIENIGQTRQWIMENTDEEVVIMMDDDLAFACRGKREDNPLYLSPCDDQDIRWMVSWLDGIYAGGDYRIGGISAREGNNRKPEPIEECARMMRAWAIHKPTFESIGARFDNLPCIEDFDVILTFLVNGYANIINNEYTTNQAGSNVEGGCSTYRTLEVQADAARALAAKYPLFVQAVEKTTKGAWGGGTRTDVKIFWKKAYASGKRKLELEFEKGTNLL